MPKEKKIKPKHKKQITDAIMNLVLLKKLEQLSGITADMFNGWVRSGALLEAWIKSAGAKKRGSPEPLV